jgi:hypothetical protein
MSAQTALACPSCGADDKLGVRQTNGHISLIWGRLPGEDGYDWTGTTVDTGGHMPAYSDRLRNLTRDGAARLFCLGCGHAWWDKDTARAER